MTLNKKYKKKLEESKYKNYDLERDKFETLCEIDDLLSSKFKQLPSKFSTLLLTLQPHRFVNLIFEKFTIV